MSICLAADASLRTDRPLTLRERRSFRTYREWENCRTVVRERHVTAGQ